MSLSEILVPNNDRDSRRETLRRFTLLCRGGKLKYAKKCYKKIWVILLVILITTILT